MDGLSSLNEIMSEVQEEMAMADARYGAFTSTHEGLGVLIEEVDELREAIRGNALFTVQREAVQVAAVAIRIATSLNRADTQARSQP